MKNVRLFDFIHSSSHLILFLCLVDQAVLLFFFSSIYSHSPNYIHTYIHIYIYIFAVFVILDLRSFQIVSKKTLERKGESVFCLFSFFFVHDLFSFSRKEEQLFRERKLSPERKREIDMMEDPC